MTSLLAVQCLLKALTALLPTRLSAGVHQVYGVSG